VDTRQEASSPQQATARMLEIWARVFERPVEPDTDFFLDLEGDSRSAVALAHWVGVKFGVDVPMIDVLDHPTPAELTAAILGRLDADKPPA
jgi:acyl carrier protein